MTTRTKISTAIILGTLINFTSTAYASNISNAINKDYQQHLAPLWDHFHRNPELSLMEHKTAKKLTEELSSVGFEVAENVGGTGIVAIMKNGSGPMIMVRADMDGLPVKELS